MAPPASSSSGDNQDRGRAQSRTRVPSSHGGGGEQAPSSAWAPASPSGPVPGSGLPREGKSWVERSPRQLRRCRSLSLRWGAGG